MSLKARMEFADKMASELKFNDEDEDDCFDFFNPVSKKEYEETVNRWSKAIIEFMDLTHNENIRKLKTGMNKDLMKYLRHHNH